MASVGTAYVSIRVDTEGLRGRPGLDAGPAVDQDGQAGDQARQGLRQGPEEDQLGQRVHRDSTTAANKASTRNVGQVAGPGREQDHQRRALQQRRRSTRWPTTSTTSETWPGTPRDDVGDLSKELTGASAPPGASTSAASAAVAVEAGPADGRGRRGLLQRQAPGARQGGAPQHRPSSPSCSTRSLRWHRPGRAGRRAVRCRAGHLRHRCERRRRAPGAGSADHRDDRTGPGGRGHRPLDGRVSATRSGPGSTPSPPTAATRLQQGHQEARRPDEEDGQARQGEPGRDRGREGSRARLD